MGEVCGTGVFCTDGSLALTNRDTCGHPWFVGGPFQWLNSSGWDTGPRQVDKAEDYFFLLFFCTNVYWVFLGVVFHVCYRGFGTYLGHFHLSVL